MQAVIDNWELVLRAFSYTVLLALFSGVLSVVMGTFLVACRVGPIATLRRATAVYVTAVRNTPLIIVLIFFRIAAPKIGVNFNFIDVKVGDLSLNNLFAACVVGLTVYTSTFVCEAIRSGINAVPLGQAEAARAIGLPFAGAMREVILPQAFRASVPPLASVLIALLKNTTVAGTLGVFEAFARMRGLTNDDPTQRLGIFLTFALIFVILVEIVSFGANRLERRWAVAR